ncbi:hypothetical protein DFH06DRAFT_1122946 [Mycena polygramma]|nr:hypothetical protein DFH06DRAFT_1122946 [Mycena polygramma]
MSGRPERGELHKQYKMAMSEGFVDALMKAAFKDEPCNSLSMCPTHHRMIDKFWAFIRYIPSASKAKLKYGPIPKSKFHGKKCLLETSSPLCPSPNMLQYHEILACGHRSFDLNPEDGIDFNHLEYSEDMLVYLDCAEDAITEVIASELLDDIDMDF